MEDVSIDSLAVPSRLQSRLNPSFRIFYSPIGMQLVPSGLMIILLPFIKESPRWLLTQKGKKDLALVNLAWIRKRSTDDPRVLEEFAEIAAAQQYELDNTAGTSFRECLAPGMKLRFFVSSLPSFGSSSIDSD